MKIFIIELVHFFLNHFVSHIHIWLVRKFFYRICGMKIGKKSKILTGTWVWKPWNIEIGNNSYINEKCLLDGRGGLIIGNNVSISIGTSILTQTHKSKSSSFEAVELPVEIKDNVWLGINSVVLPGVIIGRGAILAAGSVLNSSKIPYEDYGIYAGVPASLVRKRELESDYELSGWKTWFR